MFRQRDAARPCHEAAASSDSSSNGSICDTRCNTAAASPDAFAAGSTPSMLVTAPQMRQRAAIGRQRSGAGVALAAFNKQLVYLGGYAPIGSAPSSPGMPSSPTCASRESSGASSACLHQPAAGHLLSPLSAGTRAVQLPGSAAEDAEIAAAAGAADDVGPAAALAFDNEGEQEEDGCSAEDGCSTASPPPAPSAAEAAIIAETGAAAVVTISQSRRRVRWRARRRGRGSGGGAVGPGPAGLTEHAWQGHRWGGVADRVHDACTCACTRHMHMCRRMRLPAEYAHAHARAMRTHPHALQPWFSV